MPSQIIDPEKPCFGKPTSLRCQFFVGLASLPCPLRDANLDCQYPIFIATVGEALIADKIFERPQL
jgi:hypothetical protein